MGHLCPPLWVCIALLAAPLLHAADPAPRPRPRHVGGDISLLPTLEQAGARYADASGPGDAIAIMRRHGWNLFRVRLFVNPNTRYSATGGAIQDNAYALALARRIKDAGGQLLLDLHYSDTWADPAHQTKPAAWRDLHGQALQDALRTYTQETIAAFVRAGLAPDLVQIGNEITPGMLWPDGKIAYRDPAREPQSWQALAALLNAASAGVRAAQPPDRPISIMIHIDGGGQPGRPANFFDQLTPHFADFDTIGLSFYPLFGESLPVLRKNMATLATRYGKDVYLVETAYAWRGNPDEKHAKVLSWPYTPEGQQQFMRDLVAAIRAVPNGRGHGPVYWYPESVNLPGMHIWKGGDVALFDAQGKALPALSAMAEP